MFVALRGDHVTAQFLLNLKKILSLLKIFFKFSVFEENFYKKRSFL